jgi:hypothetical protein
MASLELVTRQVGNHGNHPRLPNYTARARQGEPPVQQHGRQCVTSLTTLNASKNESVSDQYAVIDEDTSTSASAVHRAANTANNSVDDNSSATDMSRNALLVVGFVLYIGAFAHIMHNFAVANLLLQ